MTGWTGSWLWSILSVVIAGVALTAVLVAGHWVVGLLPMNRERRDAITRASPVIAVLFALIFSVFAANRLLAEYPAYLPVALCLIAVGFVAAAWSAVRDTLGGVVVKAGRLCRVGDHVRVEGIEGRVTRMCLRVATVETREGDEALIPYARLTQAFVIRTGVVDGGAAHVFELDVPAKLSAGEVKDAVRQAALREHWASIACDPVITHTGGTRYEVAVFALDPDHGGDVEAAVRRRLKS
jgi:small-conductance mechanosensitive channel